MNILLLAVPGILMATVLTGLMLIALPNFGPSENPAMCMLLGTMLSATDPVAVVALLHELGADPKLATLIEGESLLNDGTAIVLFMILKTIALEQLVNSDELIIDWMNVLQQTIQLPVGGVVWGYVAADITQKMLNRIYNDPLVEITITLTMTYLTFFIGEEHLKVSGVLAVVVFGAQINHHKTRITADVEHFLTQARRSDDTPALPHQVHFLCDPKEPSSPPPPPTTRAQFYAMLIITLTLTLTLHSFTPCWPT